MESEIVLVHRICTDGGWPGRERGTFVFLFILSFLLHDLIILYRRRFLYSNTFSEVTRSSILTTATPMFRRTSL